VSGIIASSQQGFAAVTVQRSARQGHIDDTGIAMMGRLVPHVRQAFDVARPLKGAGEIRDSLERACTGSAAASAVLVSRIARAVLAELSYSRPASHPGALGWTTRRP